MNKIERAVIVSHIQQARKALLALAQFMDEMGIPGDAIETAYPFAVDLDEVNVNMAEWSFQMTQRPTAD
jgi:hypothetical protein